MKAIHINAMEIQNESGDETLIFMGKKEFELIKRKLEKTQQEKKQLNNLINDVSEKVYELLDEYDIGIWKKIQYVDLADFWVNMIEETVKNNPFHNYDELERLREKKLREYLFEKK